MTEDHGQQLPWLLTEPPAYEENGESIPTVIDESPSNRENHADCMDITCVQFSQESAQTSYPTEPPPAYTTSELPTYAQALSSETYTGYDDTGTANQTTTNLPLMGTYSDSDPTTESCLVLSILSVVFGCLPVGMAAVYMSLKVQKFNKSGDRRKAEHTSNCVQRLVLASFMCGVITAVAIVLAWLCS
ncbi:uncharacterized protein [Ptychodera flava]|uniref:uncharacterized protein n=1 Tax=Ptychodera flava TaxID=63121 RepID=UPI003969CA29